MRFTGMHRPREVHLIVAILLLSAIIIVETELRGAGYVGLNVGRVIAYLGLAINMIVGIFGIFGAHRLAWILYLLVSVIGIVTIGAETPITALYLLWASHLCGFCG